MPSFRSSGRLGKTALATVLLSVLAACGGGGGGGSSAGNGNGGVGGGGTTNPPPNLSRLTLTGTVTDGPIPNAVVTATIGSQSFNATADANGKYSVEIAVEESATGGFITLTAKGVGSQSYVEFTSLAGTFQTLRTQAGSDSILSSNENFATQITNVSTALALLLKEANGGQPVASQALIDALSPTLNSEQVLDIAAAIKLLVDHANNYPMPSGQTSLQALLADATVREQLIDDLFLQDPTAFKNAQNAIVSDTTLIQPITAATMPSTLTVAGLKDGVYPYTTANRAFSYSFNPNGTGSISTGEWRQSFTWSLSGASIEIVYDEPAYLMDDELGVCPATGYGSVPLEYGVYYNTQGAKLTRLSKQVLAITETRNITWWDCETPGTTPQVVTVARTILEDDDFQTMDNAALRGSTRTLWVYDPQYDNSRLIVQFSPDVADLRADGTGTTYTFGKHFTWSLDASRRIIDVTFAGGVTAKFRAIRELDAVATDMLYEFNTPDGRYIDAGASLRTYPQQQLAFTSDNVIGRHYIFGIDRKPIAPGAKGSRLRFDPDGRGSRESEAIDGNGNLVVIDSSTSGLDASRGFHWHLEGNELVMESTRNASDQYNCDLGSPSCRVSGDVRIMPLARQGTRTYWFESGRSGRPYLDDGFVPYTLIRYFDYEPFDAASAAAMGR